MSVPHNVWPGANEGPTTANVSEQAPAVLTPKYNVSKSNRSWQISTKILI